MSESVFEAAWKFLFPDGVPRKGCSIRLGSGEPLLAIADTVGLAVEVNHQQKPVWLIVGAFEQPGGGSFPFRFPTPMQLRACVYAGLIHGATGICYFTWDTYVCRDGNVIGMSPEPKVAYVPNPRQEGYTHPTPATAAQLIAAKALWTMAAQVNREVRQLTPSILSPTVEAKTCEYSIGVGLGRTEHPIHCLLKPHPEAGYVLLTVNLEDTVETARFTFATKLAALDKLFENQPAPALIDDGQAFAGQQRPGIGGRGARSDLLAGSCQRLSGGIAAQLGLLPAVIGAAAVIKRPGRRNVGCKIIDGVGLVEPVDIEVLRREALLVELGRKDLGGIVAALIALAYGQAGQKPGSLLDDPLLGDLHLRLGR